MFWSRWSKRISLGWAWLKPRYFGRAGRNVSRLVKLGRTWSKHKCFGGAVRNVSRLVERGRNIKVFVAPVKTYLAWSNVVETYMFWSRRSKRISLGWTWSKPICFGRAGGDVSRWIELGRNLDFLCRAGRNISHLVELGRNLDVLVAPVETYLAWLNLVETYMFWSRR